MYPVEILYVTTSTLGIEYCVSDTHFIFSSGLLLSSGKARSKMLRIVIIDDEQESRNIMVNYLNQAKFGLTIVGSASDGKEAYELIVNTLPDIALIDIEMPGLSGLDVIRQCRAENLPTKFIITSSYSEFSYAQQAISLDVEEYLVKPYLPSDIYNSIYRIVEKVSHIPCSIATSQNISSATLNNAVLNFLDIATIPLFYPYKEEGDVIHSLKKHAYDNISNTLQKFFTTAKQKNTDSKAVIHCLMVLYLEINRYARSENINIQFPTVDNETANHDPVDTLEHLIQECCIGLSSGEYALEAPVLILRKAMQYIQEHYAESLSLSSVANAVYVSPNYLSSLFSRYCEYGFSDYVHLIRVENAKRLIRENPFLKNYQIAELVGYGSAKYFSSIFAKITVKCRGRLKIICENERILIVNT